ncbi:membrane protein [Flexivirga endophytica]|uniref:Membrane protein n=1 Tax=Flexivirga endophytica TaxID=1849103 RepID=A0A916T6R4_9MICO|nr:MMPL family transporter [Flexivirga endophytica]GGB31129.1 membrane protein [Flexivirga endophytica]GHB52083.1 membrane protein [Flexivirga endophytica]
MARLLARLGRLAFRRRRVVLAVWIAVLGVVGIGAVTLGGSTNDTFSIPGTESQRAINLLEQRLPQANGASGRIVFAAPEGQSLSPSQKATVQKVITQVDKLPGIQDASNPYDGGLVSKDGRIALSQVTFRATSDQLEDSSRKAVQEVASRAGPAGVQVEFGGDAVVEPSESSLGEVIGIPFAALILFLTFGSLVAAGLPLLTAVLSVGTGLGGIFLSTAFLDLSSSVPTIALMLGLAVGIDYAVFILSRHRSQLATGMTPEDSAAHAIGTAGSAVVFAGATVIIAIGALSVVGIPFITAMGLAAAFTVAVAVLVAITLVPALMGFAGARLAKGKHPEVGEPERPTHGARWVGLVTRHRVAALLIAVVALLGCAVPALGLRLGMPDDSTAATGSTNRQAYDLLADGFGPGFNGPLTVVVSNDGQPIGPAAQRVATQLRGMDDVANVGEPALSPSGDTAIVSVIPDSGPSSEQTKQLVEAVRERAPTLEKELGAEVLVTGQTAVNIDIADKLGGALIPFLAVVVGLAMLLLMVAFRSIIVPLTAIGGFLLTIGAAFGGVVAIFQNGFAADLFGVSQPAPIISLLPIIIIAILFGLAMDYQVFLVSRMREEHVHGAPPTKAVVDGFRYGARVVTAAALIMGAVFAGFILEHDAIIKSVGFTLAFGILVDAFVVRMTLIPAVMALVGERAWWLPRWLDRLLPRVDIEGQSLERPLRAVDDEEVAVPS